MDYPHLGLVVPHDTGSSIWKHKRIQVILAAILAIVIVAFEVDMRLSGGIFEMTKESRFAGTPFLNASIGVHVLLSILTTISWIVLITLSLRRFPNPPIPGPFSRAHRFWGKFGMLTMALTGITGIELYVIGFAF
ncbi:MAG: DUF420 domain-containing protein [Polyangiaceae bacterium]|nr:DUF420 domain-containing protein [Polyangiaceae bacterium]